ncbi:22750_t:CDS:2, partial [Racocetra persica]
EIIRLRLLPLSLEEEKNILADDSNNCNIPTFIRPSFVQLIISKLPTEIIFGLPRSRDMILERKKLGGLLDAIIILFGLLSRNGSFVKALSCRFLRFCGKISFSMYLLHPIAMSFVNVYVPSVGFKAAVKEINAMDK